MIIMNKRTLRVPADEAQLGVRTEMGAEKRIIRVPRLWSCEDGTVDLAEKTVRLWYTPPSGIGDSGVISAVCSGDAINIVWEIDDRITAESGRVLVWLQFFSEGFNLQTEEAEFFVSRVRKPSETIAYRYPNELEAWEMRMEDIAARAEAAAEQAAAISGEGGSISDVTAQVSALSAGSEPTVETVLSDGVLHLSFGIPAGEDGSDGADGADGTDGETGPRGYSVSSVYKKSGTGAPGTTDVYGMSIDDAGSTEIGTFSVYNGADGQGSQGSGDMQKSVYDADNDGVVDNAEMLGGQLPSYYAAASHTHSENDVTGLSTALNAKQAKITASGILTGDGTGTITAAEAGTDYYAPGADPVAVEDGGTGASTAEDARTNLGIKTAGTLRYQETVTNSPYYVPTGSAVVRICGRVQSAGYAQTEYTKLMFRGASLNASETNPAVDGAICWTYE